MAQNLPDKSKLERQAKWNNFSANYVALPCAIVSFVLALYSAHIGDTNQMYFNMGFAIFNVIGYYINSAIRDTIYRLIDDVGELERMQRIRDLRGDK